MYAKIFGQIFDSSIAADYVVRHVFMDLLVLADRDGVVDMTLDAISRRTNVPEAIVSHAIEELMKPDERSRSHCEDGRRLILLDSHRNWGWQIVNYDHYRTIRDEESRKAYFRDYKRQYRQKSKLSTQSPTMSTVVLDSPTLSTKAEADAKVDKISRSTLEEIYFAYPLHVGKEAALKAISKALKDRDPGWMMERVEAYAARRRGEDPKYTPHPATWFNRGSYDDDDLIPKPKVTYIREDQTVVAQ